MDTMTDDLIRKVPTADEIRQRLSCIFTEVRLLRRLLRVAETVERRRGGQQPARNGTGRRQTVET